MSNPIGDPADYYFARQRKNELRHGATTTTPEITIDQSQLDNQRRRQRHASSEYPISPESPESRRPHILPSQNTLLRKSFQSNKSNKSSNMTQSAPSSALQSTFDARTQWNKVLDKLSTPGGGEGSSNNNNNNNNKRQSSAIRYHHHHHHHLNPLDTSKLTTGSYKRRTEEDSSSTNSEIYEMQPTGRKSFHTTTTIDNDGNEEDDVLPSPDDIERSREPSIAEEGKSSYFEHPFRRDTIKKQKQRRQEGQEESSEEDDHYHEKSQVPQQRQEEEEQESTIPAEPEEAHIGIGPRRAARLHWGKTFDKIRLISNIHSLPSHPREPDDVTTTNSLAPYFPPAFEAPFIALSTDDDGRKLPPILFPLMSIEVTDSELLNSYGIYQYVFRIELQYGDVKWVIHKTMTDFTFLHFNLKIKSSIELPAFPNQLQNVIQAAKTTMGFDADEERDIEKERASALARRKALTTYLTELLNRAHILVSYDLCEFLEISAISIVQDMGWKGKEGYLENQIQFVDTRICHLFKFSSWSKEWVILRDSYVAFCEDIASQQPTDVLMLDKSFSVSNRTPGIFGKYHNHISLENRFRRITIKGSKRQVDEWMESIKKVQQESPWVKNHRFGSFAPIRHHAKVKYFIDGEDHFNAVAEAILSAKSEIYIADWWLSPELYLRRPPVCNEEFRIDRLLKRKAEEGVMVYIIVYKEVEAALPINSEHTKKHLQKQHPNIIVQRHPDHRSIDNTVLFWSHHEKMVIVDNRLAFIGGLDLCYGRWDTHEHKLNDLQGDHLLYEMVPGQDYSNPRVKDFNNVIQHDLTLVDRSISPRMPWHDVTIGVVGPIARDIARHFIQRWNFLKASKGMHRPTVPFLMPKGEYVAARDETKFKGSCRVQLLRSSAQWSSGIEREHSIYNAYMECISKAKHYVYIENQFFISATTQDKLLRNRIAQAMVERIKRAHEKGEKFKIFILIPLIPAFEGDLAASEAYAARSVMHFEYVSISRGGNSICEKLQEAGINPSDYIGWYSLRNWAKIIPNGIKRPTAHHVDPKYDSGAHFDEDHVKEGFKSPSNSCSTNGTAYVAGSRPNSKGSSSNILNNNGSNTPQSGKEGTVFEDETDYFVSELIYIHDKLLIVDDKLVVIGSANVNDRSMLGNRDSEVAMLIEDTEMIPSYMDGKEYKAAKFAHSLRMQLMKEHLGLLDFTDWPSLMKADIPPTGGNGSIHGDHDINTLRRPSEALNFRSSEEIIRDIESNQPDQVLDSARRSKRTDLKKEEALQAAAALDPLTDHCYYKLWRDTATTNSLIYREIFHCVPDDTIHTFEQHRQFTADTNKIPHAHVADRSLSSQEIEQKLSTIQGHLVDFPLDYLKGENMLGSAVREAVLPMVLFT